MKSDDGIKVIMRGPYLWGRDQTEPQLIERSIFCSQRDRVTCHGVLSFCLHDLGAPKMSHFPGGAARAFNETVNSHLHRRDLPSTGKRHSTHKIRGWKCYLWVFCFPNCWLLSVENFLYFSYKYFRKRSCLFIDIQILTVCIDICTISSQ